MSVVLTLVVQLKKEMALLRSYCLQHLFAVHIGFCCSSRLWEDVFFILKFVERKIRIMKACTQRNWRTLCNIRLLDDPSLSGHRTKVLDSVKLVFGFFAPSASVPVYLK